MIDTNAIRSAHLDDRERPATHWETCELAHRLCCIKKLCDEVDRLRTELHRWQHGEQIESDYACRPALELQAEVERLRNELTARDAIFDAEKTCGELSCDECNARYAEAKREVDRLRAELQAERAMRLAAKETFLEINGRPWYCDRGDTK